MNAFRSTGGTSRILENVVSGSLSESKGAGLPSELWQLPVHVGDSTVVDLLPIDFSLYSRVYKVSVACCI